MTSAEVKKELNRLANPKKAEFLKRFFKTGKGEYAEGDKFLGITVPQLRRIAKQYTDLSLSEVKKLIVSPYHELRLTGLLILVYRFSKAPAEDKEKIYKLYLNSTDKINSWDLVDVTAPKIIGKYLHDKNRKILYKLAKSKLLWERRIAIVSCFSFIQANDLDDAIKISKLLLSDKHDLIHKAVGWMLREVGKRDVAALRSFLHEHATIMPRTALRYAIERFSKEERSRWLNLRLR